MYSRLDHLGVVIGRVSEGQIELPSTCFSPGLELDTPSLVPVKKNSSTVVVSDKYNLKPIPLKRQR